MELTDKALAKVKELGDLMKAEAQPEKIAADLKQHEIDQDIIKRAHDAGQRTPSDIVDKQSVINPEIFQAKPSPILAELAAETKATQNKILEREKELNDSIDKVNGTTGI